MPITSLFQAARTAAQTGQAVVCAALALEAEIAARQFERQINGLNTADLPRLISRAVAEGCRGIVSYGLAGGLSSDLRAGDIVVGSEIVGHDGRIPTDDFWSAWLLSAIPTAVYGPIAGVDIPVAASAARYELRLRSRALAVDMESHVIARLAAAHALRFIALRVVIDGAGRNIPAAAITCFSDAGEVSRWRLARRLLGRPSDAIDVIKLGADWRPARKALLSCAEVLGASVREVGL
jgi:hypothetical protein